MTNKNRHAYCILAHTDAYCLGKLIEAIDDYRNDIFIHLDNKSLLNLSNLSTLKSKICVIPMERRHDVRWGTYSLIETEIEIFKFAREYGEYSYYHLISGQDLPIKSQDEIHHFFESVKTGTNFIGFKNYDANTAAVIDKRVTPYHVFKDKYRHPNKIISFLCRGTEETLSQLQRILGMKINKNVEYRKGCNWVSITNELVEYIIENENLINKLFSKAIIQDELFIQTLVWNSPFKSTLYDTKDEYVGCVREIDWNRGNPYTWRIKDFKKLVESDAIFARKFSSKEDKSIIDKIVNYTLSGK